MTLQDMKQILINKINKQILDKSLAYQNGNLEEVYYLESQIEENNLLLSQLNSIKGV